MAIIKKPINNKGWRGCGEREPSYTVGGNANEYSHPGEQCGAFSNNEKASEIRILPNTTHKIKLPTV